MVYGLTLCYKNLHNIALTAFYRMFRLQKAIITERFSYIWITEFFFFFFGQAKRHTGSYFPDQVSNPCSLQWKLRVLTTGSPENSLQHTFSNCVKYFKEDTDHSR